MVFYQIEIDDSWKTLATHLVYHQPQLGACFKVMKIVRFFLQNLHLIVLITVAISS